MYIKLKATNEQTRKTNNNLQTQPIVQLLPEGRGMRVGKGKGGQIHDEGRFDFGWWAHSAIYR